MRDYQEAFISSTKTSGAEEAGSFALAMATNGQGGGRKRKGQEGPWYKAWSGGGRDALEPRKRQGDGAGRGGAGVTGIGPAMPRDGPATDAGHPVARRRGAECGESRRRGHEAPRTLRAQAPGVQRRARAPAANPKPQRARASPRSPRSPRSPQNPQNPHVAARTTTGRSQPWPGAGVGAVRRRALRSGTAEGSRRDSWLAAVASASGLLRTRTLPGSRAARIVCSGRQPGAGRQPQVTRPASGRRLDDGRAARWDGRHQPRLSRRHAPAVAGRCLGRCLGRRRPLRPGRGRRVPYEPDTIPAGPPVCRLSVVCLSMALRRPWDARRGLRACLRAELSVLNPR